MAGHMDMLVAVLDDEPDLATTIARLLKRKGFNACAFDAPETLLKAVNEQTFGCIISDIQMGDMDGFAFADVLRSANSTIALVFMTAWPKTAHAVDAVRKYGGLDYLEKPIDESRLIAAVKEGLQWSDKQRRIVEVTDVLTKREKDVFDLLTKGYSNKEIAEHLQISARTVEDHRSSIVAKFKTNGLAQLIALSRGEAL